MAYVAKVTIDRHRSETTAECEQGCLHPDSTRERVRQHVAQTGHTARVIVKHETLYRAKAGENQ